MNEDERPELGGEPSDQEADALFCRILDHPQEDWHRLLEELAGENSGLLRSVRELLQGAEDTDSLLRPGGAAPRVLRALQPPRQLALGTKQGRYRILEELSRGGMGVVYLAERADGHFDQKVALKLMLAEGDPSALGRFTQERQILADLQHPNIARLVDGGVTDDGCPFLVMDYVDGTPIDQYCRDGGLDLRRRLRLLMEVCTAVSAAHRQLVVHRDLKPSNILVTADEQVKLLDFGIAKLLAEDRSAARTVGRFLTPQYASPEQLRGDVITVASDVYQLGLIAYELITERRPYDLGEVSAAEAERKVCREAPTLPSRAATASRQGAGPRTGPDPDDVGGDLDLVVLKALHKDPERRYASVDQLREDLDRYLRGLPILARPDSVGYRLRMFVGRHRWGVAVAAAAFLTLAGLVSAFTWSLARERDQTRLAAEKAEAERARAEQQQQETEEVVTFLTRLFEASDPYAGAPPEKDLTARELLDRGAAQLEGSFDERPLIQARLLQTTGGIYARMEDFERAELLLRRALALREAAGGDHREEVAESLESLGRLLVDMSRAQEAEPLLRRALALREDALGPLHPQVAEAAAMLANALHRSGDYRDREALLKRAVAIYDAQATPEKERYGLVLSHLGRLLAERGDLEGAEARLRRSLDFQRQSSGPDSLSVANASKVLGLVLAEQGRCDAALPFFEDALRIHEGRAGVDSLQASNLRQNLAVCRYELGDLDGAESLFREDLATVEGKLGGPSADTLALRHNLASLVHERGDAIGAERELRQLRRLETKLLSPSHKLKALTEIELARTLISQQRYREALDLLRPDLRFLEDTFGPQGQYVDLCLLSLAQAHRGLGERKEARSLYRRALEVRRSRMAPGSEGILEVEQELGDLQREMGPAEGPGLKPPG
ncbi:MAG: serine/threonine protein kinase [Acidobacteria bacterium]|nr:serine/threonine protein kinase [Acidobacteriota bacterium]